MTGLNIQPNGKIGLKDVRTTTMERGVFMSGFVALFVLIMG